MAGLLLTLLGSATVVFHYLLPIELACMAAPSGTVLVVLGVGLATRGLISPGGHHRWPGVVALPIGLFAMVHSAILALRFLTGNLL
jgi:hypothetical protein